MTRDEVISYGCSLDGASSDKPFEGDFESTVLRHSDSRNWFGLVMFRNDKYIINLKCEPEQSDFLKNQFKGITPAYHMNKRLWISVDIASVPDDETKRLIRHSYELTK